MKFLLCNFCLFLFFSSSFAQQNSPNMQSKLDFSGTWILDISESDFGGSKGELIYDSLTLVISQQPTELKVIRQWAKEKKNQTQDLLYYTDGRGEKNFGFDKNEIVKSKTNLKSNMLQIKGTSSLKFLNNEMTFNITEKWKLSDDGQILQISSSSVPINALPGMGSRISRKVFKKKS